MNGDYTQRGGTLALTPGTPLKVTGKVTLGGKLVLGAVPASAAASGKGLLLIDNAGKSKAAGAFTGITGLDTKKYEVNYRAGDGNDVALVAKKSAAGGATAAASTTAQSADGSGIRTESSSTIRTAANPLPWWMAILAAAALSGASLTVAVGRSRPGLPRPPTGVEAGANTADADRLRRAFPSPALPERSCAPGPRFKVRAGGLVGAHPFPPCGTPAHNVGQEPALSGV